MNIENNLNNEFQKYFNEHPYIDKSSYFMGYTKAISLITNKLSNGYNLNELVDFIELITKISLISIEIDTEKFN